MNVLFVCQGNTCRSPMLEFVFGNFLRTQGEIAESIKVRSAGMEGSGRPMSRECAAILKKHGIPFYERKSVLCDGLIASADVVLTMTRKQADFLQKKYGDSDKIIPLATVCGRDIQDPYGNGIQAYEDLYQLFNSISTDILRFLSNF